MKWEKGTQGLVKGPYRALPSKLLSSAPDLTGGSLTPCPIQYSRAAMHRLALRSQGLQAVEAIIQEAF